MKREAAPIYRANRLFRIRKGFSMVPITLISIFAIFVLSAILIGTYNRFVKYKNRIEEAWSGIDVALKRRSNLIPNLIQAVEGYKSYEAQILGDTKNHLAEASDTSNRAEEESRISKSLRGVIALAEAYPDLKASANFIDLQNSLAEMEEDIQQARDRYNRYVGKFNTLVESFPAVFIARKFKFEKRRYFVLDLVTQRELPEVQFSVSSGDR